MEVTLREARTEDAEAAGRICYDAFYKVNTDHNFPPEFPSVEVAIGLLTMMFAHPGFHAVVAEHDGRILGSNVLDERSAIAGIGPISVAPTVQNGSIGRRLMAYVLERAATKEFPGTRLVQAAFHNRSLSLYTKLGFEPREPLSCMQGPSLARTLDGYRVRRAVETDLAACNAVCTTVHGHTRSGEVLDAIRQGACTVVEHEGRITGYTTGVAFFGHSAGETINEIKALIAAAPEFGGPGFLLPTRNGDLMRWCFANGLRIVEPLTLMTIGLYNEPRGAYLPSILY
jgi:GNAT superfamily N-acetyltransferase